MKDLIDGFTNEEILKKTDKISFFVNEVNTPDIQDNELRIAVQSLKMARDVIQRHMKDLQKEYMKQIK